MRSPLSELGFITDRFNNDLMTNSNGLHLIDMCKSFDLSIVNGRFGDDKEIGDYTCYNKNGGRSTVDYAIVSNNIFENIVNFNVDIFDNCLSAVHCPITLSLHAISTTNLAACVCVSSKFDQFLPLRFYFVSKRPENFVRIAKFPYAAFGPLFAFHCPLFVTKNNNLGWNRHRRFATHRNMQVQRSRPTVLSARGQ